MANPRVPPPPSERDEERIDFVYASDELAHNLRRVLEHFEFFRRAGQEERIDANTATMRTVARLYNDAAKSLSKLTDITMRVSVLLDLDPSRSS